MHEHLRGVFIAQVLSRERLGMRHRLSEGENLTYQNVFHWLVTNSFSCELCFEGCLQKVLHREAFGCFFKRIDVLQVQRARHCAGRMHPCVSRAKSSFVPGSGDACSGLDCYSLALLTDAPRGDILGLQFMQRNCGRTPSKLQHVPRE